MKIHKVINNNIVIVIDEKNRERILMGRGIGFRRHSGDKVDEHMIDREFSPSVADRDSRMEQLFQEIPESVAETAIIIMDDAAGALGGQLSEGLFIALCDHIYTALCRNQENVTVKNMLLWEIKRFYPKEYQAGRAALETIRERTGVMLAEDEAGFIAMHLVNAQMGSVVGDIQGMTKMMQEILNIVKYSGGTLFNENSVGYCQFVMELKFLVQRILTHTVYEGKDCRQLLEVLELQYLRAYQCVSKIAVFLKENYGYVLSGEEQVFMTIQISRIIRNPASYR